jgi:PAS domain S-box-containing protein
MRGKTALQTWLSRLWAAVPSGGSLPESVWRSRRRFLVGLTWFHAVIIMLAGLALGYRWDSDPGALFREGTILHTLGEGSIVAAFAALATWSRASRMVQATAVGFGLMSSSAILVHLSGGYIELHFHFFVMLVFLALLQDWIPYILAVAYVAVHHGVVGVLWPEHVFNHSAAFAAPWTWAGIHAFFVLWSCVGSVIAWRFNERALIQTTSILEAAGEGIFGLDEEGVIIFINPAAANMLGTDRRRAVGAPVGQIVLRVRADGTPVPNDPPPLLLPLRQERPHHASNEWFARADGSTFPVDYVSTPMIERGLVTGVVVTFQDISERKRAEADLQLSHQWLKGTLAELKATQQQLLRQERLRAIGQMASGIAHDFNNTLSPILSFSELLLDPPASLDEAEAKKYIQLINTAARDAAAVVRRLRELYRERGEARTGASVDIARCVGEAIELTQPRWKSQAQANGVTINVETEIGELSRLIGDPAEIREVLTNLIFNAVDAMPRGGTITIRARTEDNEVRLEVEDTGRGMTEDVRQRCMEPFFSTKGPHGSGLGLATVQAIVERAGGRCEIESEPGHGTTFTVLLPARVVQMTEVPAVDAGERGRRLRILVVEDEPMVRRTTIDLLAADGHSVDSAANGAEGLEKLLAGWFDLVVTDRAMPEISGDQFTASIMRHAPGKPVIMLTGFGDLMLARGERPPGVTVLMSKPITRADLRQAVLQATSAVRTAS